MGTFVKGRCPVCGWELSPNQWKRQRGNDEVLGLFYLAIGRRNFVVSPLMNPNDMEFREPGLLNVIRARLVDAIGRFVRRRWVTMREVLNALPLRYLGGGIWVEDFERDGKRPSERSAVEYDLVSGKVSELYWRDVKPIVKREVRGYVW